MTGNRVVRLTAAAALAAVALAGCENTGGGGGGKANSGICVNFAQPKAAAPALAGGGATLDDCAQRWAYSLAPSRDDAETVADAVVAACSTHLVRWNQQTVTQPEAAAEGASITTGQPTSPVQEHYAFAQNRALLYVVQARAGQCSPPAAKAGAPEGVAP